MKKAEPYLIWAFFLMMLVGWIGMVKRNSELEKKILMQADTITNLKTRTDTIKHQAPKEVTKENLQEIRFIKVPTIYVTKDDSKNDTIVINDSIGLPVEQKVYTDDSTYTAWISGSAVKLDSINTYQKTITESVIVTKTVYKKQKLGIGISAGATATSKGIMPGLTIGLIYQF